MPKRLCLVFNSLDIGGIERKIVDICRYYSSQKNVRLTLVLKHHRGPFLEQIPKNITVISPPELPGIAGWFPLWLAVKLWFINPSLILAFGNYCSVSAVIAKLISRHSSPIIISEDSSVTDQISRDTLPYLRRLMVKLTYPKAVKIIVLTEISQKKLSRLVPPVGSKIAVLSNWLPLSLLRPTRPPKDIDVLFLGRFEPQKDPLKFLHISRLLLAKKHRLKIAMMGAGSLRPEIEKYIGHYHLPIRLLAPSASTALVLERSKILLLTSRHEGFPLTVLESLYFNCLPVCPALPELKFFFRSRSELLYAGTAAAVSQVLHLLPATRRRRLVGHFRPAVVASRKQNFEKLLAVVGHYL